MTHDLEMEFPNAESLQAEYLLTKKTSMAKINAEVKVLDSAEISPKKKDPTHKILDSAEISPMKKKPIDKTNMNVHVEKNDGTDKRELGSKSLGSTRIGTAPSQG